MSTFCDERYAADEYIYGTLPNVWFRDNLIKLSPGNLLLPAEREGRKLNPGGTIIFEGFSKKQIEYQKVYKSGARGR